jgi:hypothetical protein
MRGSLPRREEKEHHRTKFEPASLNKRGGRDATPQPTQNPKQNDGEITTPAERPHQRQNNAYRRRLLSTSPICTFRLLLSSKLIHTDSATTSSLKVLVVGVLIVLLSSITTTKPPLATGVLGVFI